MLAGSGLGLACAKLHTELRQPSSVTAGLGPVMLEGWITDIEAGQNGPRLRINVHAISGEPMDGGLTHVRLTHALSLNVGTGRFVRCWAVLRPPPQATLPGDYDFARQAYFEGLDAVGYVQGRCRGGVLGPQSGSGKRVGVAIAQLRRMLATHVNAAAGERAGGFAAALTSGDRSFMDTDDVEALRNSGLAHLLAISGLHLGIVATLVYFAVRRSLALWEWLALRIPVQKLAAAAAIAAALAYMCLSGASISTQRAFIMASVFFGAIILDRSPLSLRSFSVALIIVVLMHPHTVMSPGFQMSFAATGALIASFEYWNRRRRDRGLYATGSGYVLKSLLMTSFVGTVATAPFALYHFDRVAPMGLAANILAMPVITFISAPVAGLSLIAWPFGLADYCLAVFGWSLEQVLGVAHWASKAGGAGFRLGEAMPGPALIALVFGLAGLCLVRRISSFLTILVISASGAAASYALADRVVVHVSASGNVFVRNSAGEMEGLLLDRRDGLDPLRFSDLDEFDDCRATGCMVDTQAGLVFVGAKGNQASICSSQVKVTVTTDALSTNCPDAIQLVLGPADDFVPQTVMRGPSGRLRVKRMDCGTRRWNACPTIDQS